MKKAVIIVVFIYLSILSFLWMDSKADFQDPMIKVGSTAVSYVEHVTKEQTVIPFLLSSFYEKEHGNFITLPYENSGLMLETALSSDASMKIERSDTLVYDGKLTDNIGLLMDEEGIYSFTIRDEKQLNFYSKVTHIYQFRLAVRKKIRTVLSSDEVKRGSFVMLNISSLKKNDSLHIESTFPKKIGGQYVEDSLYVYYPIAADMQPGVYTIDIYNHDEKLKSYHVRVLEEVVSKKNSNLDTSIKENVTRLEKELNFTTSLEEKYWDNYFSWPLIGEVTANYFDTYQFRKESYLHQGIDITAEKNMPVKSVLEGKVIYVGETDLLGNVVVIDHGHFLYTCYGHLQVLSVKEGDMIQEQTVLGRVGERPLHFAVRMHDVYLDPFIFLKK